MYIEPDIERQRQLRCSEKDIGLNIVWCPKCDFQHEPGIGCKPKCPECGAYLHLSHVTKELLDLIAGNL